MHPLVTTFANPWRAAVCLLALGAGVCAAPPASAQSAPPAQTPARPNAAPQINQPTITMDDAVKLTIAHDPQIKLGEQNVVVSNGGLQSAKGTFDWTLKATPSFDYGNTGLQPSIRQDEFNKRLRLQTVATAFGIVNRTLLDQLALIDRTTTRPPRCPLQFPSVTEIVSQGVDPLAIRFPNLAGFENTFFTFGSAFSATFQTFKDNSVCASPDGDISNSGSLAGLMTNVFTRLNVSGLQEAVVTLAQAPNEILGVTQQIAQAAAASATLALDRLGVVPVDEIVATGKLNASFSRVFRSGLGAGLGASFASTSDNFKDKSLDPGFGGTGKPIKFNASVFGTFNVPLERGRGIAVSAPETAARLTLSAQTDQWRHTATSEAFRTVLAYLTLVGSQESLKSLDESFERQGRIQDLTRQQVAGGDLAGAELARVQASTAQVAASQSQARQDIVNARVSLAEAMGVDVETMANAPLAADFFSESPKPLPPVDTLMTAALAARLDARASSSLRNAAEVLEAGAYANARPRIDMSVKVGMSTFYDDLTFFFLPDEVNPVFTLLPQDAPAQPSTGAVMFSSPVGYGRAFSQTWRPLGSLNFVLDLPFHNSTLRGRATQAEASRRRASIQERDLMRVIRENIVNQVETLKQQAAGIERAQAAVVASQQTVDATIARFQQADVTLIDTLLAEQSLTQDRLTLVRLWQAYLSELARLRFETGTLVTFTGNAVSPDQIAFDPTEFVRR